MILFLLAFPYWSQNGTLRIRQEEGGSMTTQILLRAEECKSWSTPHSAPTHQRLPSPPLHPAIMALFICKSYIAMPRNSQTQNEFPGYIPIYQVRHKSAATYITLASNGREVEIGRAYMGYCHSERKHGPFTKEDKKNGYWVTNSCVCHGNDQFPKPC